MDDCEYVAVSRIGLSSQDFWRLSWYEWGLLILRLSHNDKQRQIDHELFLAVMRIVICDFRNANFTNEGGRSLNLKPTDIFKLRSDTEQPETKERPMTFQEAKLLFGSRLKKEKEKQ